MKLNVAGLVLAASGMVLQISSGSELYPVIPPGPIVLVAAAAAVAFGPRRWSPYIATVVPAFLIVGGIIASVVSGEFVDQLTDVGEPGIFIGSVAQVVGLITALVAGIGTWRHRRPK